MKVTCTAIVEEPKQRDNLCECIEIIGGYPDVVGNTVFAEYDGESKKAHRLMSLFKQYPFHGISVLS